MKTPPVILDRERELVKYIYRCKNTERGVWMPNYHQVCKRYELDPEQTLINLSYYLFVVDRPPRKSVAIHHHRARVALMQSGEDHYR